MVVDGQSLVTFLFFLVTLIFLVFTIVVAYHWFTYGNSKKLNMLALAIYLLSSAPLFLIMAVSLVFM